MKKRIWIILAGILILGIGILGYKERRAFYKPLENIGALSENDVSGSSVSLHELARSNKNIDEDLMRLKSYSKALKDMSDEMYALRKTSKIYEKDYFEPREHDQIESLLFRYLICRNALWEMVNYYMNFREHSQDPVLQNKEFLIGFSAGLHMSQSTSLIVSTFLNEPSGKAKINEAYPAVEIPRGSYDMLFKRVTSKENLQALKMAWYLFEKETKNDQSLISRLSQYGDFKGINTDIVTLYQETEKNVDYILKEKAILFPGLTNELRQSIISDSADKARQSIGDTLYAMRSFVSSLVGDTKVPVVKPIEFTKEQVKKVKAALKPGDIILTYSAGYMSNIFLPGNFKHGILYVGPYSTRNNEAVDEAYLSKLSSKEKDRIRSNLARRNNADGLEVDVIEAVSEGVVLNSISSIMDNHINRMVVLRPLLTEQDMKHALYDAFSLVGMAYDFKFDFNDGTNQCCTEVIYRILNSRSSYAFNLVKRAGSYTLSADDIVHYYLNTSPEQFDFVLLAQEDENAGKNIAKVYFENEGEEKFKALVKK